MKRIKAIAVMMTLSILLSGCGGTEPTNDSAESENHTETDEMASEVDESTPSPVPLTDKEILLMNGHPKYLGVLEKAHEIWDGLGLETNKIRFGDDSFSENGSNTILNLWCNYNDYSVIREINIYFTRSDMKQVPFDDAIEIAHDYLPYDTSFKIKKTKGEKIIWDGGTDYIIYYDGKGNDTFQVLFYDKDNDKLIDSVDIGLVKRNYRTSDTLKYKKWKVPKLMKEQP